MSIVTSLSLFCDGKNGECSTWFDAMAPDEPAAKIRRYAKRGGWTRRRAGGRLYDLCPECSALNEEPSAHKTAHAGEVLRAWHSQQ
jgi:hypothetical protein